MRSGIFGGTFDPPHNGHLQLVAAARAQLRLDKVLWVLTADPPHKQDIFISPIEDRLALTVAAIAEDSGSALSRVDIDRPGPHWAADTVALLAEQFPTDELIYLMGGDSLRDLPTWGRPLEFLAHCSLGVLRRPDAVIDLPALERQLPGLSAKVEFVTTPPIALASRDLRRLVREGHSLRGLVPEAVERIIHERKLYGIRNTQ
jgi:nicotinate-nucleotide adenylyltransferase